MNEHFSNPLLALAAGCSLSTEMQDNKPTQLLTAVEDYDAQE